ncbi:MAG TPA: hypothetical protein VEH10_02315 [Thermoplasmata archaeon]|nr:hypothetical protein [Thermoplasmata archaeon]
MNAPIGWWWPLVAVLATALAFAAGPTYELAVPAATVAVIAAALTIVEVIVRQRAQVGTDAERPLPAPGGVRGAFTGGEPGREDIVLTIDLLERKISRPDLPARTGAQIASIVRRPPAEFRRYLAERLDALEAVS